MGDDGKEESEGERLTLFLLSNFPRAPLTLACISYERQQRQLGSSKSGRFYYKESPVNKLPEIAMDHCVHHIQVCYIRMAKYLKFVHFDVHVLIISVRLKDRVLHSVLHSCHSF